MSYLIFIADAAEKALGVDVLIIARSGNSRKLPPYTPDSPLADEEYGVT